MLAPYKIGTLLQTMREGYRLYHHSIAAHAATPVFCAVRT